MSVKVRKYRKGGQVKGWQVDVRLSLPALPEIHERRKAPGDFNAATKGGNTIERSPIAE